MKIYLIDSENDNSLITDSLKENVNHTLIFNDAMHTMHRNQIAEIREYIKELQVEIKALKREVNCLKKKKVKPPKGTSKLSITKGLKSSTHSLKSMLSGTL